MKLSDQIVDLISNRNEKGLQLIYDNYSKALYGITFRVLNNQEHAENALQNCFLKVWQNIEKYDSNKASLYTWMSQIARNAAIDIRRLKSFEREEKTESLSPVVSNNIHTSPTTDGLDVEKLLAGLDEKYSFILEHLYLKGYTQRELAEKFDIPLGTIKTRLRAAISQIRNNLKDEKAIFIGIFIFLLLLKFILF